MWLPPNLKGFELLNLTDSLAWLHDPFVLVSLSCYHPIVVLVFVRVWSESHCAKLNC